MMALIGWTAFTLSLAWSCTQITRALWAMHKLKAPKQ